MFILQHEFLSFHKLFGAIRIQDAIGQAASRSNAPSSTRDHVTEREINDES